MYKRIYWNAIIFLNKIHAVYNFYTKVVEITYSKVIYSKLPI